jgi:hypothetical protein
VKGKHTGRAREEKDEQGKLEEEPVKGKGTTRAMERT